MDTDFFLTAIDSCRLDLVESCIKRGCVINPAVGYVHYRTLLTAAVTVADKDAQFSLLCVKTLIENGADVDRVDYYKKTALMEAAGKKNLAVVTYLLSKGANFHIRDSTGYTALMYAAKAGDAYCLAKILSYGAQVNAVTEYGQTAFMLAAQAGSLECLSLLVKNGANVNAVDNKNKSALVYAASAGNVECLTYLLTSCAGRSHGALALYHACGSNSLASVEFLIKEGFATGRLFVDTDGTTAMMKLASKCRFTYKGDDEAIENAAKICNLLLKHGAGINAVNNAGQTALVIACETSSVYRSYSVYVPNLTVRSLVCCLVQNGANVLLVTIDLATTLCNCFFYE